MKRRSLLQLLALSPLGALFPGLRKPPAVEVLDDVAWRTVSVDAAAWQTGSWCELPGYEDIHWAVDLAKNPKVEAHLGFVNLTGITHTQFDIDEEDA